MKEIVKRNSLAGLVALVICIALLAAGCSTKEEAAMDSDTETNAIEENVTENAADTAETADAADTAVTEDAATTEDAENTAPAAASGVYAEIKRSDKTVEITPIPGGITDSTVLPTFKCTFGDMTNEAQMTRSCTLFLLWRVWPMSSGRRIPFLRA